MIISFQLTHLVCQPRFHQLPLQNSTNQMSYLETEKSQVHFKIVSEYHFYFT